MIYTIGYQGKSVDEIRERLLAEGIRTVVDVRRHPVSRWRPDCSKSRLESALASVQIDYEHIGALGTPREIRQRFKETADRAVFRSHYGRYLDSQQSAFGRLVAMVTRKAICLLCYEHDADQCHRSYLAERLHQTCANVAGVRHLG